MGKTYLPTQSSSSSLGGGEMPSWADPDLDLMSSNSAMQDMLVGGADLGLEPGTGNAAAQDAVKEKNTTNDADHTGAIVGGLIGFALGGIVGGVVGGALGALVDGQDAESTPPIAGQAPDPKEVEKLQAKVDEAKALDAASSKATQDAAALDAAGDTAGAAAKRQEAADKKAAADAKKNEAIQTSIKVYKIDTSGTKKIVYDGSVSGEADTSKDGVIRVGDEAFRSAGWLGSSVGHESEIHWQQQAQKGNWYNGPTGTAIQEVQAYDYEIANATRYGTTEANLKDLKARRDAYFKQMPKEYQDRATAGDYTMKKGEEKN